MNSTVSRRTRDRPNRTSSRDPSLLDPDHRGMGRSRGCKWITAAARAGSVSRRRRAPNNEGAIVGCALTEQASGGDGARKR
jgi:hypothetical protein